VGQRDWEYRRGGVVPGDPVRVHPPLPHPGLIQAGRVLPYQVPVPTVPITQHFRQVVQ